MTRIVSLVVLVCAREFWKKLGAEWSERGSFFFIFFAEAAAYFSTIAMIYFVQSLYEYMQND